MLTHCSVIFALLATLSSGQNVTDDDIRMPPSVTLTSPKLVYFKLNEWKTLECGAIGYPVPTYTWRKNGVPLAISGNGNIQQQDQGTILFNSPSANDAGYYQCFISNKWGTTSTIVTYFQLASLSVFAADGVRTVVVNQNDPLKLQCEPPSSVPTASYSWVITQGVNDRFPTQVPSNARIQVNQEQGDLVFAYAEASDTQNGTYMYRCGAYNAVLASTVGGTYTTVTVLTQNPSPASQPSYAFTGIYPSIGLIGQQVRLVCFFQGFPVPAISWRKANGDLPAGRHVLHNDNTVLQINDLQFNDQGDYVCTAVNSQGTSTRSIQLNVDSVPTFSGTGPVDVNATTGDTVTFSCLASGIPTPTIRWYSNLNPLDANNLPAKFSLSSNLEVLTISNVCRQCSSGNSDLQVIQCNVTNSRGYAYGSGFLNVLDPTVITTLPESQSLVAGSPTILTCPTSHDPSTPITITWYFNGNLFVSEPGQVYTTTDGGLYFNTPELPDGGLNYAGNYTCVVSNGYSSDQASAIIGQADMSALKTSSVGDYWWVFLIIVLFVLLIIGLVFCIWCLRDNRGDSYPVDEKERDNGNDPDKELQDNGFQDFQRSDAVPLIQNTGTGTSTLQGSASSYSYDDGSARAY